MVARAQGTSLIFHFVAYRYRGAAAARRGAAAEEDEARLGASLPPPPSTSSGHTRRAKRWRRGRERIRGKEGKTNIYIYVYIERRRGGGAASPERGRGALYYIERRNVAAEIVSSPSPRPSPANKDEVSANIILVTGYLSGRNDDFLVHPSVGCIVEVF